MIKKHEKMIKTMIKIRGKLQFSFFCRFFLPLEAKMMKNDTSSTAQGGGGSFKNRKPIGEVGGCESGMAERSH